MTTKNNLEENLLLIRKLHQDIRDIEDSIRRTYDRDILDFFSKNGIEFKLVNNKYSPINIYEQVGCNTEKFKEYAHGQYYTPRFQIDPWDLKIHFKWEKKSNQSLTRHTWDPMEMSLDHFYNTKLKKTLCMK